MTTTRGRVIATATAELGVRESPSGSNRTKYTRAFGLTGPWCAMFVWWVLLNAGAGDARRTVTPSFASCQAVRDTLSRMGRLRRNKRDARPGDIALYQFDRDRAMDHIGIIVEVTALGVVAIEGNTSATHKGNQSNGGMVARRFRPWSVIAAVGVMPGVEDDESPHAPPAVQPAPAPPPSPAATNILEGLGRELQRVKRLTVGTGYSTERAAVTWVQWGLNASKIPGCVVVPDGAWGPFTRSAVKHFQKSRHLVADGIVGPATWSALYP